MICNFDAYAKSGHHHHIATLRPGVSFHGVYLLTQPPTVLAMDNEEYYSFTVSDLTGRLACMLPVNRAQWQQGQEFRSQRLLIEGKTVLLDESLTALVRHLEPVQIIW